MNEAQRDAQLLPVDSLLLDLPEVELDADSAHYFCQGQPVWKSGILQPGVWRVYQTGHAFLGLGENLGDGQIAPRRLVTITVDKLKI